MVNQEDLEALRAEHAALGAENAALRKSVVAAQLAGDPSALTANERPSSPMARVAILTREQKVLMASLRLGEELVALKQSNEVLARRAQQLQEKNLALQQDNNVLVANRAQHNNLQAPCNTMSASPGVTANPALYNTISAPLGDSSHPAPKKKCSPEEKAERRELVAAVLKAGLNQDVHTITTLRPTAVHPADVPRIQINPAGYERLGSPGNKARGRDLSASDLSSSGARIRESSHSGAVQESKYLRELAIRDMLLGISRNTPRATPRS